MNVLCRRLVLAACIVASPLLCNCGNSEAPSSAHPHAGAGGSEHHSSSDPDASLPTEDASSGQAGSPAAGAGATPPTCDDASIDNWARAFAGADTTTAQAVIAAHGGGYLLAGTLDQAPGAVTQSDAFIAKLSPSGTVCWSKTYGTLDDGDSLYAITPTADGGYAFTGETSNIGRHVWVVKLAADGEIEWQLRYGSDGSAPSSGRDIVQTDDDGDGERDDGFAVAVRHEGLRGERLLKLSAQGEIEWAAELAGVNADAIAVRQIDRDRYLLLGDAPAEQGSPSSVSLLWLSAMGSSVREQIWTFADRAFPGDLELTADGGFVVAGYVDTDASSTIRYQGMLLKFAADGGWQWGQSYGSDGERLYDVVVTADGYALTGATTHFGASSDDFWFLTTDGAGALQTQRRLGEFGGETARSLAVSDGQVVLAGSSNSFFAPARTAAWAAKLRNDFTIDLAAGNTKLADTTAEPRILPTPRSVVRTNIVVQSPPPDSAWAPAKTSVVPASTTLQTSAQSR